MRTPSFNQIRPWGFTFAGARHWIDRRDHGATARRLARDTRRPLALDGAPVSGAGGGFPASLFTLVDPEVIEIRTAPRKARELFPERRLGDWSLTRALNPVRELVGTSEPYDDRSDTAPSSVNYTWMPVANYVYQTFIAFGERERAMSLQAGVDLASDKQRAAAEILSHDENRFYLFGVDGMPVYGILNHPDHAPSVSPRPWTPPGSATPVTRWNGKDAQAIYEDLTTLFSRIARNSGGHVDETTPLKLVVSPETSVLLGRRSRAGDGLSSPSALEMLHSHFSDLTVVTLPELASDTAGETVLLYAPEVTGQLTGELLYSEKIRTFQPFVRHTTEEQKWVAGVWGFQLYRPFAIATMTGV
ncbi:DUF2184 domain-containing protein [Phaeovibrio sulfidiphilus]|uniref:DUF2184 domain-containing protein n=1 Tax=Phaeovibrio sulfidiphilus TaxID=1220600 RepID=A0A8J7CD58_9PROT|nr:major capsid family protein [Phaeovibrio sulfidiphilus]MBE1237488.1 DUF2184 domain-containing protein [Phaeovibrio sulfidiphilus]